MARMTTSSPRIRIGSKAYYKKLGSVILSPMGKWAYEMGLRHAAEFAGSWDSQIMGTKYSFEDIVLGKFNLLPKEQLRPKQAPIGKQWLSAGRRKAKKSKR